MRIRKHKRPTTPYAGLRQLGKATPVPVAPEAAELERVANMHADKLYLVVESIRPDNKHQRHSTAPVPADGAEGFHMV